MGLKNATLSFSDAALAKAIGEQMRAALKEDRLIRAGAMAEDPTISIGLERLYIHA